MKWDRFRLYSSYIFPQNRIKGKPIANSALTG